MTQALQVTCGDCGQEFAFSVEDQAYSRNAAIRLRNDAKRAAKRRKTSKAEEATAVDHALRQRVPCVAHRPRCRLNREAIGLYIARIAIARRKEVSTTELGINGAGTEISDIAAFRQGREVAGGISLSTENLSTQ